MAKNKKISSTFAKVLMGDENEAKIGNYKESTGGGTPLEKGEKLKDHPEAKRVQQPRDEEGKFTYNSVNRKPLKYGPSRGTTVVPFLKGVKIKYAIKKGDKINYNGMIYLAGMDITAEEVLKTFREWKEDEGFGKMETGVSKKVGRRSNEEREAIAKGDQGFVGKHLASLPGPTVKGQLREKLFEMYKTEYGRNANKNRWQDLKKPAPAAFSKQIDTNLAKRDKEAFKQKYRTNINKSKEIMPNLTDDDIVDMLSSGMFKHFSDFREGLQKIRGEA